MQEIAVGEAGIRLGQLLKLAGLVESGGSVKTLLVEGAVEVNGRLETRRGAQLKRGDNIRCGEQRIRLT
ncbi:MAG: RNA-binding S4 domain-containing protein [Geodermatophilaceae bacterium]|nr:RNA-binding S4 domain-containing protein [Geodermatophilaceae bacterium]